MFFDFYLEKETFESDVRLQKEYNTLENLIEFSENINLFSDFKDYKFFKYLSDNYSEDFISILVDNLNSTTRFDTVIRIAELFHIDGDKVAKELRRKLKECPY